MYLQRNLGAHTCTVQFTCKLKVHKDCLTLYCVVYCSVSHLHHCNTATLALVEQPPWAGAGTDCSSKTPGCHRFLKGATTTVKKHIGTALFPQNLIKGMFYPKIKMLIFTLMSFQTWMIFLLLLKFLFCVPQKKFTQVWKDMKVSKWWQNFHVCINYSFNIKVSYLITFIVQIPPLHFACRLLQFRISEWDQDLTYKMVLLLMFHSVHAHTQRALVDTAIRYLLEGIGISLQTLFWLPFKRLGSRFFIYLKTFFFNNLYFNWQSTDSKGIYNVTKQLYVK